MIVALEGGDAVGKHTQSKILAQRLNAKLFAFPNYESPTGRAILGNLQNKWMVKSPWAGDAPAIAAEDVQRLNAMALQSLMLANRLERTEELRAAAKHGHVVFDRYAASAEVYGSLDGLDREWLRATNNALPVQPDVYVLLDAPVEEGFRRRPERRDRYESNRGYLEKVRAEYLLLFRERAEEYRRDLKIGNSSPVRYTIVDATGSVDEVTARIWDMVGVLDRDRECSTR